MGTRAAGIGILLGSVAFGGFALRTPPDSPDAHPLPSATAEYSTRPSKPRFLPWLSSRSVPSVPERAIDKSSWSAATVRVVDLDGRAVAGAEVEVRLDARAHALVNLSAEEYDDIVAAEEAGAIRVAPEPMIVVDRGRTDREGVFATKLEPNVLASIVVRDGEGREGVSASLSAVEGAPTDVTVEVAPVAVLAGRIEDGDGNPIAGAQLTVSMRGSYALPSDLVDAGAEGALRTADDGSFRVPVRSGGAVDVSVTAAGFQPMTIPAVQVLPGRETRRDLTLAKAALLTGRLLDPEGEPVPGRIDVHALDAVDAMSGYRTLLTEDGTFSVDDIAPARYRVVAHADGFPPVVREPVIAGEGPLDIQLEPGGRVRGEVRVVESAFRRLAPAAAEGVTSAPMWGTVWLLSPDGSYFAAPLPNAPLTIDATGRATFELPATPPGRWLLRAQVMNVATVERVITVSANAETAVSIALDGRDAARVHGVVRSSRGTVTAGSIFLQPDDPARAGSYAPLAEDGAYDMPWVPEGAYTASVSAYVNGGLEVASLPVEVRGGVVRLDLETSADESVAAVAEPGDEEDWHEPYEPDLEVEWSGDGIIVGATAMIDGVRIWAGDRVTSIDGVASDENGAALASLPGAKDSICRITLVRPVTGETFAVEVPRTRPQRRHGCGLSRRGDW